MFDVKPTFEGRAIRVRKRSRLAAAHPVRQCPFWIRRSGHQKSHAAQTRWTAIVQRFNQQSLATKTHQASLFSASASMRRAPCRASSANGIVIVSVGETAGWLYRSFHSVLLLVRFWLAFYTATIRRLSNHAIHPNSRHSSVRRGWELLWCGAPTPVRRIAWLVPIQLQLLQSEMLALEKTADRRQRQPNPLWN